MDKNFYPPMDGVLKREGIKIIHGYGVEDLPPADLYIVGNALSRGVPAVEHILSHKLNYASAPQWLAESVLRDRKVIAVAGTHGKTTTTALITKILVTAGNDVGYLIGGEPKDFPVPANLGKSSLFIIEADEYDSAFFDKRSKFIHYKPDILLINNLEFDHADIFPDLAAIKNQFCHLLRTLPSSAQVIYPLGNEAVLECLKKEPHSKYHRIVGFPGEEDDPQEFLAQNHGNNDAIKEDTNWWAIKRGDSIVVGHDEGRGGSRTAGSRKGSQYTISINRNLPGKHNAMNLLFASVAATLAGASPDVINQAARSFRGVARRLETIGTLNGAEVISDFAHHPTAIYESIKALKESSYFPAQKLIAVVELASNSMRLGAHNDRMLGATVAADELFWFAPNGLKWNEATLQSYGYIYSDADELADALLKVADGSSVILLMSNSSLGGLLAKLELDN